MSQTDQFDDILRQMATLERRVKALENPKVQLGSGFSGARWFADDNGIRSYDGSATNFGAPSGAGVTTELRKDGTLFGSKVLLQSSASGARIILDSTGAIMEIIDPNGVTRVEQGNLSSNGVSAAGWKFRANDASGNPIFDSDGLISVMQQLGRGDNISLTTYTTTTPTLVSGTSVTFSLSRSIRVLAFIIAGGFSATQTGILHIFLDGTDVAAADSGIQGEIVWGISGPTVTSSNIYSTTLSAGSHTFDLRGYVTSTPATLSLTGATLIVYGLGS